MTLQAGGLAYLFGLKAYGIKEKISPVTFQPAVFQKQNPGRSALRLSRTLVGSGRCRFSVGVVKKENIGPELQCTI